MTSLSVNKWYVILLRFYPHATRRRNLKTEFSLRKTHHMFVRPHYAGKIWKRNNRRRQKSLSTPLSSSVNHIAIIATLSLRKAPFSNRFSSRLNRKAGVFTFLRFEERFRKAPFSWRISVDGRPNSRNAFTSFSGVVMTGLRQHSTPGSGDLQFILVTHVMLFYRRVSWVCRTLCWLVHCGRLFL